ncbi:MAG: tyrosine-type recombinase/integrase [Anaerolineae bacterium]|jgi:site-specific recombinase XerD|nr:tyrosine-type recombinase/integrase [Anaerolineae bacterium]
MLQTKVVESYCTSLEALGRAERTIEANKERLEGLQKFLTERGVVEIENVDPELLDAYISSSYRKGLSVFTVAGRVQVIKTFFKWSVERRYLETSPASHLKKPRLNYSTKDKVILQEDLEAMILFARRGKKLMVEVMLILFADTGCRSGELCGMDIEDIDFVKKEILVNGKTGERLLDFTFTTAIKLGIYVEERGKMNLSTLSLFVNSDGERIKPRQVYGHFRVIAKGLNVKRFNPQAIRHRVGQGWLDQGANLETVRQKLGHKDIQTTALFYSHQDRGRLKKASQKFCLVKNM